MRRGWGHPSGNITTAMPEFRAHLAAFALDQLWHLYVDIWGVARPVFAEAGLSMDDSLSWDAMKSIIDQLLAMHRVPFVHAHEWNLGREGPIDLTRVIDGR
jgi:hypothetical protein